MASFELTKNFNIEAAYVGRQGRNLLVQRDLFMPLNLVDPQSGTDYFTASTELIKQLEANGMDYTAVTPIAYFENLFPDAANAAQVWEDPTFAGLTATQVMAYEYASWYPDHQSALFDFDLFCYPACTKFGPNSYLNRQYRCACRAEHDRAIGVQRPAVDAAEAVYATATSSTSTTPTAYAKDHGSLIERNDVFSEPRSTSASAATRGS